MRLLPGGWATGRDWFWGLLGPGGRPLQLPSAPRFLDSGKGLLQSLSWRGPSLGSEDEEGPQQARGTPVLPPTEADTWGAGDCEA